jgi:23S rRNA (adenine2503-C2)-methyltransferase
MPLRLIKNLTEADLTDWLKYRGHAAFRLKQIRHWLYVRWEVQFADMGNLPAALRQALAAEFLAFGLDPVETQEADDGTVKWLFRLSDGESLETVLIRTPERQTVCISTQVGCPVRCTFCASGRDGLVRDLEPAEIVDQVIAACRHRQQRVDNIVVMGMGEPLLNLDNLVAALDLICGPEHLGIGARHVTISTSGIVPGIHRLAELRRQWHLALSLHALTDEARARLIPSRHRYPLAEIVEACRYYRDCTGRIVTLEYALMAGGNDSEADAVGLASLARNLDAKINLIPCNEVSEHHRAPDERHVRAFEESVRGLGAKVTLRQRKGERIQAACGQLRRRTVPPSPGTTSGFQQAN